MEKVRKTVPLSEIAGIMHSLIGSDVKSWSLKGGTMLSLIIEDKRDTSKEYEILAMAGWDIQIGDSNLDAQELATEYVLAKTTPGKIIDIAIRKEELEAYIALKGGLIRAYPQTTSSGVIWIGLKDSQGNFYTIDETDSSRAVVTKAQ